MSLTPIISTNTYRPSFYAQIDWAQGPNAAADGALRLLLTGNKLSAGGMSADQDVAGPFTTQSDIDNAAGAGSELSVMGEAALGALRRIGMGAQIYLAASAEASGGTAATVTLLLGGTWTTQGPWELRIKGKRYTGTVAATDTNDTLGAAIAAAVNADPNCPFTAAYVAGSTHTLTLTCRQKGGRGKDWIIAWVTKGLPAGLTSTLTGSATIASVGGVRVRAGAAGSGTGVDDVTNIKGQLVTQRYARIAAAQNDTANIAAWKSFQVAQEAPGSMVYDDFFFGHNGTQTQASTLAQSNLNVVGCALLAQRNDESHPAMIAAAFAAVAAAKESGGLDRNLKVDYEADGFYLGGISPVLDGGTDADSWLPAEQEALLAAGVTPLVSTRDGNVRIVRAVTSYSLLGGSTPDDRAKDRGDRTITVGLLLAAGNAYRTFRAQNPDVGPDPAAGEDAPSGVAHPSLWARTLQEQVNLVAYDKGLIEDPRPIPPGVNYNAALRGLVTEQTWVIRRLQHVMSFDAKQSAPTQ